MEMRFMPLHPEQPIPCCRAQISVAGDVTLPGSLREEATVLYADAMAVVENVESMQDRLAMAGRVVFRVLYTQGDPARTDCVEATADFTHLCDMPGLTPHSQVEAAAEVGRVDATANGGRMNMRAQVIVTAKAVETDALEVVIAIPEGNVQQRTRQVTMRRTLSRGMGDVLLREEFALPAELSIRDTLFAKAQAAMQEASGGQERIGLNGEVSLTAVHLSDLPGKPIAVTHHTIPVQQSVAVSGESAPLLDGRMTVKDVAVAAQANDDGTVLRCEVLLGLSAWADKEETATVLDDAYTTDGDMLVLTRQEMPVRTGVETTHAAESWRAPLLLEGNRKPISTVLAAFATPSVTAFEQQGNRLMVTGEMDATLVYMPDDGAAPASARFTVPLRVSFATSAAPEDTVTLTADAVEAAPITGDRAELRCILHLDVKGSRSEPITLVTGATAAQADAPTRDIVLYFAQDGEKWWEIARRYRITEERLHALNPDRSGDIKPGQGVVVWRAAESGQK